MKTAYLTGIYPQVKVILLFGQVATIPIKAVDPDPDSKDTLENVTENVPDGAAVVRLQVIKL